MPKRGWRRGLEYLGHRVKRLPDTPRNISMGLSCGAFVSFTPFFGLHIFLAIALARLFGGNILASLIGTVVGNPLTFPFIASISLGLGREILGHGVSGRDFGRITEAFKQFFVGIWESIWSLFGYGEPQWQKLSLFVEDVWLPYCVGGFLPGIAAAIATFYLSRPLIVAYQARRRARRIARRKDRLARKKKTESDVAALPGYMTKKKRVAG